MSQVDYVIRISGKAKRYLARDEASDLWTTTLAEALIFTQLEYAEARRDKVDMPGAEVFELSLAQHHVPRAYSFDVKVRISSMSEESAFLTLRKMVENMHNEFDYACVDNNCTKLVRVDHRGSEVSGSLTTTQISNHSPTNHF